MKKDPVRGFKFLVIILGITTVMLPIISLLEKKKTPGWTLVVMFLFCSMLGVYGVIKNMASRIDELEKKLETNQTEKAS